MTTSVAGLKKTIASLTNQKRYAWGRYYEEVNENMEELRYYVEMVDNLKKTINELNADFPIHITLELQELYEKIKHKLECPICMEIIEKDKLKITPCGHKFCVECYNQIDKCALCKKEIKH